MPANITDVSAFTDPIVVPADSDPLDRTYVVTAAQGLANRTRHLHNRFDVNGEINLPSPLLIPRYLGIGKTKASSATVVDGRLVITADSTKVYVDLTETLSRSAEIVRIRVLVHPGAARTGTNRMNVRLYGKSYGVLFTKPVTISNVQEGSAAFDDGTAEQQWVTLDFSSSPVPVANRRSWYLEIIAGNTAGADNDDIYDILVESQTSKLTNV